MRQKNEILTGRVSLIRKLLPDYRIDGLFFFNKNNIRYLSGFTGSDGVLLLTLDNIILLVDGRYTTQALLETKNIHIIEYTDKVAGLIKAAGDYRLKKAGFEADSITVDMYNKINAGLGKIQFVPLADELKLIRARKDETEISLIKKAAEISSSAVSSIVAEIREGVMEKELAMQLEYLARRLGADEISFPPIVASGENSALPHACPSERKIKDGDFIIIDFGVRYGGYCSDETCTFAFGELTDGQKHAYQIVKEAHDKAIATIKSTVAAAAVDLSARSVFGEKHSPFFSHSTGHGVGLEVHEAPRLASNSPDTLSENMVVTVEPGLYFPGQWGVRIEDMVLVKENSCEKLTKMDKELIFIK
ncbi:MAG TPA: aminopeptidase P family protein [Deltaproteobacteria bacterium]|nr:aminopeptidase P family protein [Deltaproteobacteria bacterium]